ncbi:MAG TPA: M48 family metallopeptidase [Kofleriaceae bacterium]|nr:M48 family metallopeptidase [Kofleriaceae bacterium]
MDFDFGRYVAYRKGMVEQRARDGAAYGYVGERKLRRALTSARPVALAIEATTRMWKGSARRELLAASTKASDRDHARVHRAAQQAATSLGVEAPPVVVPTGEFPEPIATLGTDEEPIIVVTREIEESLDDRELMAALGHELGHVQNNQVFYATALHYLRHEAFIFVRWIVQPAVMALQGWSRRAEVTCDRAALLAVRDLDVARVAMVKVALGGVSTEEARARLAELGEGKLGARGVTDLFSGHPHLSRRARAMQAFVEGALYRKVTGQPAEGGLSGDEVDTRVSDIIRLFG